MRLRHHIARAVRGTGAVIGCALLVAAAPRTAFADVTFTPEVASSAERTDNAGQRSPGEGVRGDTITTARAGGELLFSHPLWAVRATALGEYERYLSADVRNTWATGGLEGIWHPDETTRVRSKLRASYAPDRYDPRIPYRLIALGTPAADLPLFVRATTLDVDETAMGERWITELVRGRVTAEWSSRRYSDRRGVGSTAATAVPAVALQSRTAAIVGGELARKFTETALVGGWISGARADYEAGPSAYTTEGGGLFEWEAGERTSFAARAGGQFVAVPGPGGVPPHLGWEGALSLRHDWLTGSAEVEAKDGVSVTTSALPAAEEQTARLVARWLPFEHVETSAYAAATREHSAFAVYRATGTATILSAGGALGWRMTRSFTARIGFDHVRQDSRGLVEIPYRANTAWIGITFTGRAFGDPPALPE